MYLYAEKHRLEDLSDCLAEPVPECLQIVQLRENVRDLVIGERESGWITAQTKIVAELFGQSQVTVLELKSNPLSGFTNR